MRVSVILFIGVVLVALCFFGSDQAVAREAPDFTLRTLAGDSLSLSDYVGSPVVISFFTTWCPFCAEELSYLQELYSKYGEARDLKVVGVNIAESEQKVQELISRIGITYPVLLDEGSSVASQYRVVGLPTSYLVNPDGSISDMIIGASRPAVWMEKLEKIFWYEGLEEEDIEELVSFTTDLVLLDLRGEKENPFPDHEGVQYILRRDIDTITEGLQPDHVYLIYADTSGKGVMASRKLAQEGFTMIFYRLADDTEP